LAPEDLCRVHGDGRSIAPTIGAQAQSECRRGFGCGGVQFGRSCLKTPRPMMEGDLSILYPFPIMKFLDPRATHFGAEVPPIDARKVSSRG
jgi:hypothetical protein